MQGGEPILIDGVDVDSVLQEQITLVDQFLCLVFPVCLHVYITCFEQMMEESIPLLVLEGSVGSLAEEDSGNIEGIAGDGILQCILTGFAFEQGIAIFGE